MNDEQTTVSELKETVEQFVRERNWKKFHTPKNISMALAVEVAERQTAKGVGHARLPSGVRHLVFRQ